MDIVFVSLFVLLYFEKINKITETNIVAIMATKNWLAPLANPIPIIKKDKLILQVL